MDILQLLKDDWHALLGDAEGLAKATTKQQVIDEYPAFNEKARMMVATEQRFLIPEIEEIFADDETLSSAGQRHKSIVKHLDKVRKLVEGEKFELAEIQTDFEALLKALRQHHASAENVIMPRMRREISTADREDLAMVYLDAKQESIGVASQVRKVKAC